MLDVSVEELENCTYLYSTDSFDTNIALWIDGPCTLVAALLSLVGAHSGVRFLWKAGLSKELTAALSALCVVDSFLMIVVFLRSIEAISVLVFETNVMFNRQAFTLLLHGLTNTLITASTMLVIYITFLRFMVVVLPMRYAGNLSKQLQKNIDDPLQRQYSIKRLKPRKIARSLTIPIVTIVMCFVVNASLYFEFTLAECFDVEHHTAASHVIATPFRETFAQFRTILMTLSQTIGPILAIFVLSVITEYRLHISRISRKKLFESQQRRRSVVLSEELKERVSRFVAIFIAVKFVILRSMPVIFDIYENLYGIESFGVAMSVMVRVSDFLVVLNSATNSLAYFGKKRWLERLLRLQILRKEDKKQKLLADESTNLSPERSEDQERDRLSTNPS